MSKLGYITTAIGQQFNMAVTNTTADTLLNNNSGLIKRSVIIAADNDNGNDNGTYTLVATDTDGMPVRLTYTMQEGDGFIVNGDIMSMSIDNKTIKSDNPVTNSINAKNELFVDMQTLVDNETIKTHTSTYAYYAYIDPNGFIDKNTLYTYATSASGNNKVIKVNTQHLDTATASRLGVVSVDNRTITSNSGNISLNVNSLINRQSNASLDVFEVSNTNDEGIIVTNSYLKVTTDGLDKASSTTYGIIRPDNSSTYISTNTPGVISANPRNMEKASPDSKGVVKYDGITIQMSSAENIDEHTNDGTEMDYRYGRLDNDFTSTASSNTATVNSLLENNTIASGAQLTKLRTLNSKLFAGTDTNTLFVNTRNLEPATQTTFIDSSKSMVSTVGKLGVVYPDSKTINVSDEGQISVDTNYLQRGTGAQYGIVKVDNNSILYDTDSGLIKVKEYSYIYNTIPVVNSSILTLTSMINELTNRVIALEAYHNDENSLVVEYNNNRNVYAISVTAAQYDLSEGNDDHSVLQNVTSFKIVEGPTFYFEYVTDCNWIDAVLIGKFNTGITIAQAQTATDEFKNYGPGAFISDFTNIDTIWVHCAPNVDTATTTTAYRHAIVTMRFKKANNSGTKSATDVVLYTLSIFVKQDAANERAVAIDYSHVANDIGEWMYPYYVDTTICNRCGAGLASSQWKCVQACPIHAIINYEEYNYNAYKSLYVDSSLENQIVTSADNADGTNLYVTDEYHINNDDFYKAKINNYPTIVNEGVFKQSGKVITALYFNAVDQS